jgi:type IV pilus assembly protein PilE
MQMSTLSTARSTRALSSGFTLIELMIVVAIIAILASIAYPSYTESIRKSRRAEARAAVMNLLQQQERFLTQNGTYAAFTLANAGTLPFKDYSSNEAGVAASSHRLGARVCAATGGVTPTVRDCIEVFAQPQAGVFTDPVVTSMAIDTLGRRTCTGSDTSRCWK